jgi:hypothetical protein
MVIQDTRRKLQERLAKLSGGIAARSGISRQWGPNMFDRACLANGIEHRLTKPRPPWTTDEVEQPLFGLIVLFCCRPRATT